MNIYISGPQNGGNFENSEIFKIGSVCHHVWKDCQKLSSKSTFNVDDVMNNVSACRQNWPSIYMFK